MKNAFLTVLCFLIYSNLHSQGFGEYVSENAIEINTELNLDSVHYNAIKNFDLIMVGEIHGTNEPVILVEELSKLILKNEKSVSIGIEIPEEEMSKFIKVPNDSTLKQSRFFLKENRDGKNGQAWFDLLKYCNSESSINLFFFDNYKRMKIENRDSVMYEGIKNQKINFPNAKIITISGNIHNMLVPYNEMNTMGSYCDNDSINFPKGSICSIDHAFSEGTLLNNEGNGLELRTIEYEESIFSESSNYNNYMVFFQTHESNGHSSIFYTRKVSHSKRIKKK